MLSAWELWACANQAHIQHGDAAPVYIAERIGACVIAGDVEGLATWKAIADRYSRLAGLSQHSLDAS